jgi:hypothetical protein
VISCGRRRTVACSRESCCWQEIDLSVMALVALAVEHAPCAYEQNGNAVIADGQ